MKNLDEQFPYQIKFPLGRRSEVYDFFVEYSDIIILSILMIEDDYILYCFENEETAILFKLKFGGE